MNNTKEKLVAFYKNLLEKIKPKLILFDEKVNTFLPNPKVKKVVYIAVGSLFGFMFLIIFLGLLLSPLRQKQDNGLLLNKPKIIVDSPKPEVVLTEKQKEIVKLKTEVNEMKFPESILNIPIIETNLSF